MKKLGKTQSAKVKEQESGLQRVSGESARYIIEASAASSEIDECPFETEYLRQQSFESSNQ